MKEGSGILLTLAGYFARRSPVPLSVMPISDTAQFSPLLFQYDIAIGVRKGDHARKAAIDDVLGRHRAEINGLLEEYGIPLANGDEAAPQRAD